MNKQFVQARAQAKELERRIIITEEKAKEYLEAMSQKVQSLEVYSEAAVKCMDPYTRNKFVSQYGNPPRSPSIA